MNSADRSPCLDRVLGVIDSLLGPNGCPWDKKQTPESLCDYLVEEAFELVAAIRAGDQTEVMEELGDVLFLLLFVARLYADQKAFGLDEVLRANAEKMIRRHPHVFGDKEIKDQQELIRVWEKIKRGEKDAGPGRVFGSLPRGLPPLLRAYRINSKAARNNFTWASDQDQERHLASEWEEFRGALAAADPESAEREFGDYLFSLVETGRRKGIKANAALDSANQR
ncbi:MAG: nucleoside triphosphate pyrophosphohydrolase, partial [Desulfovibrionaceae bacterium]|nr:nucleoside triphosphate pyrophosphohydrolase [Desulfovibrionaceae bacterium]